MIKPEPVVLEEGMVHSSLPVRLSKAFTNKLVLAASARIPSATKYRPSDDATALETRRLKSRISRMGFATPGSETSRIQQTRGWSLGFTSLVGVILPSRVSSRKRSRRPPSVKVMISARPAGKSQAASSRPDPTSHSLADFQDENANRSPFESRA